MCQKSPERRKVGDTLTAIVDPEDADVEFQWYSADDEDGEFTEIEDATAATYVVQAADYGKFIKVVASDALGNEDSDVTAEAVTVGEGVTITDVEQTGEYTAILTFSGVAPDGTITAIKGESKATVNADYQLRRSGRFYPKPESEWWSGFGGCCKNAVSTTLVPHVCGHTLC